MFDVKVRPTRHFQTASVQDMLDDLTTRGLDYPVCLENDSDENPLEIVLVMTPQTAIMVAEQISRVQVNSAIEAFYRQIYFQVEQLPETRINTRSFFRLSSVEALLSEID